MANRPISRPALGLFTTTSGIFLGISGGIANFTVAGGHPLVLTAAAVGMAFIPIGLVVCYGRRLTDWWGRRSKRHIEISTGRDEDINAVYDLAVSQFGEGVTPPDQIRKIRSRYADSLKTAHWVGGGQERQLCGYYMTIPMNRSLANKIHFDRFKAVEIDDKDIPTRPRYAYAIYIGGIVGTDRHAKAELTGALKAELAAAAKTKSGLVYARAATEAGLRIIEGNGFEPVHSKAIGVDCFYYRDVRQDQAQDAKVQATRFEPMFA